METASFFNIASKYDLKSAFVPTVSNVYYDDVRADEKLV